MTDQKPPEKHRGRGLLLAMIVAALILFVLGDFERYLNLEALKSAQQTLDSRRAAAPLQSAALYFAIYVLATALSIPGALILTLAGGALFGLWKGTLLVSFAASVGATLAFLSSRYLLRDSVSARIGDRLDTINRNLERDGPMYLFTLRLVPLFPFFVINLLMGLTKMPTRTFYAVSQIGMLPATLVFVNAGTELAAIESPGDILSPGLIGAFVLIGLFPWLARVVVNRLEARRALSKWRKPAHFDHNLVVIGAGSGGLVSAYIAAAVKARVTLIEAHAMGGDCLNTGCVPSKALIKSARVMHTVRAAARYGIDTDKPQAHFARVMQRVREVISTIEPHDSVERYAGLGVNVIQGRGVIRSPWEVEVNGEILRTKNIIVATGARPMMPPIPGLETLDALNSDTIWSLDTLPARLLILGGGPIGCELAQSFQRLGSAVTLVEMAPRLLGREDADAAAVVRATLEQDGVTVMTGMAAESFTAAASGGGSGCCQVRAGDGAGTQSIEFDRVLIAVGRQANVRGFGLEELGVRLRDNGTIETDAYLATNIPTIHAVGDVTGPYQLTHAASHQAWYAAINALFGRFHRFAADYRVLPRVTYTEPELAQLGLEEQEAIDSNVAYEVTRYDLHELDRAIADGNTEGFIKVLTVPGKDRILGVTIVGAHAGELIAEYALAMRARLGLNKVLGTVHAYPTLAEANKYVAGNWLRAHQPGWVMGLLERVHAWGRG